MFLKTVGNAYNKRFSVFRCNPDFILGGELILWIMNSLKIGYDHLRYSFKKPLR